MSEEEEEPEGSTEDFGVHYIANSAPDSGDDEEDDESE